MRTIEITPSAPALIQSLRGLGYSPETALADLIDNSIAANANSIELTLDWNEGNPSVTVLDDGCGMDESELVRAMCFGGRGPLSERSSSDLGRFGLGLKTASLSQCRRITVISRREGRTSALAWDVDEVDTRGRWEAIIPEPLPEVPLKQLLLERLDGTLVLWDRMDPIGGLSGLDKETFFLRLQEIRAHLSMVFHRYLGGDARRITITTNNRPVRPWTHSRGHTRRSRTRAHASPDAPVWIAQTGNTAPRYRVNRVHPAVSTLFSRRRASPLRSPRNSSAMVLRHFQGLNI